MAKRKAKIDQVLEGIGLLKEGQNSLVQDVAALKEHIRQPAHIGVSAK